MIVPCSCALPAVLKNKLVQKGMVDTQLIAHDKEVYDIAWGGVGVFASVSADGSVRVFDLRFVSCFVFLQHAMRIAPSRRNHDDDDLKLRLMCHTL